MDWGVFFDTGVLRQMLVVATPLVLAALGELIIERAGVLNVAIEGMMAIGASAGFLAAYATGSAAAGAVAAMGVAGLLGLVLAYGAVSLRAPQLTLGLALFVLGNGLASLLYRIVAGLRFVPPQIATYGGREPGVDFPGAWLLTLPAPTYVVLGLAALLHLFLFHTPAGMRVRACGENPKAADLQGINVFAIRYACTLAGSLLIGAAGALLPMLLTGTYSDGMVSGRGWISLMLVILGRWLPLPVVLGGWLFGYVEALQHRLALAVHAVPGQFLLMLPYLAVIVVAIRAYRGAAPPQALMRPYHREARG